MKKILLSLLGVVFFMALSVSSVQASEVFGTYDLTVGGEQTYSEIDENGDLSSITVTEDQGLLRLANKAYTISKSGSGWHVSYKIGVSNNNITNAYGLNAVATRGSFTSSSLHKISNKKAQWSGRYKSGLFANNVSCTATISGKNLNVG